MLASYRSAKCGPMRSFLSCPLYPSRHLTRSHHVEKAQATQSSPLPPTFRSLYRLFLRATAASVLAHPDATSHLRRQWRPAFDNAACVLRQIQDYRTPPARRDVLTRWYMRWETQMDNTLSLLYSSATSRGLSHRATQNLFRMIQVNSTLRDPSRPGRKPWRGQLPPDSPEYQRRPIKPPSPTHVDMGLHFHRASHILREVVGMAEGFGGVSLGRTRRRG